jgi:hypothetical protein
MAYLFAECLAERGADAIAPGTPEATAAVKRAVNRIFNELDRSKPLGEELRELVSAFESRLKAVGERRNLRWLHRWGSPLLGLEGAALEAAVAGLDARRALVVASLSPRDGSVSDEDRVAREELVAKLAGVARRIRMPHREVAAVVTATLDAIARHGAASSEVRRLAASWESVTADDDATPRAPRPPQDRSKASPGAKRAPVEHSLRERAERLAQVWVLRQSGQREPNQESDALVELVARVARRAPRRAERLVKALERATHELGDQHRRRE